MTRYTGVAIAIAMVMASPLCAQEDAVQEIQKTAKVNITAEDFTAAQVAAEIEEQTGVQVAVTEWTEGSLTGTLEDFTVEETVASLGRAADLSWVRFYMLETAPPEEPYSAAELLLKLEEARNAWIDSLTEEQRGELFGRMRGRRGGDEGQGGPGGPPGQRQDEDGEQAQAEEGDQEQDAGGEQAQDQGENEDGERGDRGNRDRRGPGMTMDGPGGAIAIPPAPEGEEQDRRARFRRMGEYEDPIRGLLMPGRTDTITLELADAPLADALTEFMLKSHFVVIADEDLIGAVSLQLEDAPLSDALDAMAEASGAQWRPVYVVSAPRKLTEEELAQREASREQRFEERFNERWAEFWEQPKEERAASIEERVERMQRMAERLERRRAENPERAQRWERRMRRFGERMMQRMTNYANQLTPEQRQEIKPLLRAMQQMQN